MKRSRPALAILLASFLVSPVAAEPPSFRQVDRLLSEGRYTQAAKELLEIGREAGRPRRKLGAAEEKVLRGAIRKARAHLTEKIPPREADATRQVLCLSRAWFPDELPGIENALRVGGRVHRPELIGKPYTQYTEVARRARVQGTVIVESVIDREGCVRQSRLLRGLPLGLDGETLKAIRNWTFRPATLDGRPVGVYYVLTVSFNLGNP